MVIDRKQDEVLRIITVDGHSNTLQSGDRVEITARWGWGLPLSFARSWQASEMSSKIVADC